MGVWLFVRHAQSVANAGRWFSGHTDVALSELGEAQALRLRSELGTVSRAVASDLRRAYDTARVALGEQPVVVQTTAALRERDMGAWTGRPIDELEPLGLRAVLYGWETRPPGGESLRDATVRATRWLAALPPSDSTLVVAHGGVLRGVLGVIDGLDIEAIPQRIIDNACVHARRVEDWGEVLRRLG